MYLISIIIAFTVKNILYTEEQWVSNKWKAKTRTVLQFILFCKSLRTPVIAKEETNEESYEDKKGGVPQLNNLMTVDIDQ